MAEGLQRAFDARQVVAVTGHSQGLIAALLLSEFPDGRISEARAAEYLRYAAQQGRAMERAQRAQPQNPWPKNTTPMLAIDGFRQDELQALLKQDETFAALELSVINGLEHCVVSGDPATLRMLQNRVETLVEKNNTSQTPLFFANKPLRPKTVETTFLSVSGAFHSSQMVEGRTLLREIFETQEFPLHVERLQIPVISCLDGADLRKSTDLLRDLLDIEFTGTVDWPATCASLKGRADVHAVLSMGPGNFLAAMTEENMRGRGCTAYSLHTRDAQIAYFAHENRPIRPENDYRVFRPTVEPTQNGSPRLRNRYTRTTGHQPIILAGMTPTTADVPIVAAAANAGFTAELAGGGQVSAEIFEQRIDELSNALELGVSVVFNALYLDRYLWNLHLGEHAEVFRAQARTGVFCGVTVSAGIPPVDEAVALLQRLEEAGLYLNAFKPGTVEQIDHVLAIADAAPHHTISVHVEGGEAGGHHSWEALDDLLLARYHALRQRPNLLLCVGGGIGTEDAASSYLRGDWSRAYGVADMPVDAVLVGTAAMATAEAKTSRAVKHALVHAEGGTPWVPRNRVLRGCTSGQSSLNADIHYLETHAAACSRLLDEVLAQPKELHTRREEIIDALNRTSRPYFGDLHALSIHDVLHRLVAHLARGNHGRYDDGAWKDITWRGRVFDLVTRLEARYQKFRKTSKDQVVTTLQDLDDPAQLLTDLATTYPIWREEALSGADRQFFLEDVCKRPGKPVPFVPVIDADLRKWFRADSLNDSHDDRFDAEQVFVIPGPTALAGITEANEPVASLLRRFSTAAAHLLARSAQPVSTDSLRRQHDSLHATSAPAWAALDAQHFTCALTEHTPLRAFFASITTRWSGAIAELIDAPTMLLAGTLQTNPLRNMLQPHAHADVHAQIDGPNTLAFLEWNERSTGEKLSLRVIDPHTVRWVFSSASSRERFSIEITRVASDHASTFHIDPETWGVALRDFYTSALFDEAVEPTPLFGQAIHRGVVQNAWQREYMQLLSSRYAPLQVNSLFSLSLPAIFQTLLCEELAPGLLDLVHKTHDATLGDAWPPQEDESFEATAQIRELRAIDGGTDVVVESAVHGSRGLLGVVHSVFHLRGLRPKDAVQIEQRLRLQDRLTDVDDAELSTLAEQPWVQVVDASRIDEPVTLRIDARLRFRKTHNATRSYAEGVLLRNEELWAKITLDDLRPYQQHPVHATWHALQQDAPAPSPVVPKTLAHSTHKAPPNMALFAEISGDHNPIHRSHLAAQLAGLDAPIVHGMWTAGRVATALDEELGAARTQIIRAEGQFLSPLYPNEAFDVRITRQSVQRGALHCRAIAKALEGEGRGERTLYEGTLTLRAPHTAWVFPGQGIQQPHMGMEGYERSPAARAIWNQADQCTRKALGFSILRVVRENPQHLQVRDTLHVHPDGVLYLTQFTQVAMAVLACAQIAELREANLFTDAGIACGHSVGEYTALAAVAQVLPLEAVIKLVYKRGLAMDTLVERDASGQSPYALGVIRPHYAGLSAKDAEALVQKIQQRTGLPLEIVNYNIEGRQYSVTGRKQAIAALEQALAALAPTDAKAPFVLVPGIDVPFHSAVLRDGVHRFREDLEAEIPTHIDPALLVHRYIPNLTAKLFELTPEFVQGIIDTTDSDIAKQWLNHWDDEIKNPAALTRKLLIELLAWQFASPVRWIETQRLLFGLTPSPAAVERIAEVGVGYQPTLANMANYSARIWNADHVQIVNIESNRQTVFFEDEDIPHASAPEEASPATVAASPGEQNGVDDSAKEPAAADAVAQETTVPSPTRAAQSSEPNAAIAFGPADGLRGLLAFQANLRPDQLEDTDTIEALMGGVSSRRNQALVDLGEEFGVGPIDGAHELPLAALADALQKHAPRYKNFGPYLQKATQIRLESAFGHVGIKPRHIAEHLENTWQLDAASHPHVLLHLALALRTEDSARGGALQQVPAPSSKDEATSCIAQSVHLAAHALHANWTKPTHAAHAGATVDSAALQDLRDELIGSDGVLSKLAASIAQTTGQRLVAEDLSTTHEAPQDTPPASFRPEEAVWFDAAWAHARKDLFHTFYGLEDGSVTYDNAERILRRVTRLAKDSSVQQALDYFEDQARANDDYDDGDHPYLRVLHALENTPAAYAPTALRPTVTLTPTGDIEYEEVPREDLDPHDNSFAHDLHADALRLNHTSHTPLLLNALQQRAQHPTDFSDRVALVTGASPGSIGAEIAKYLLQGGATVIVTSSRLNATRRKWYRTLYQRHAIDGARLCCVPCDFNDPTAPEALIQWLTSAQFRTVNGQRVLEKKPLTPNLVIPFAAPPSSGMLSDESKDTQPFDIMVLSVHRLIGALTRHFHANGTPAHPTQLLVPLSPNHGIFGGDGLYSESKAALETLRARWQSEYEDWGQYFALTNATIGWVRGTGLMEANDTLAAILERFEGVRTWSNEEMAWLLTTLCLPRFHNLATEAPLDFSATGGLEHVEHLAHTLKNHQNQLDAAVQKRRKKHAIKQNIRMHTLPNTRENNSAPATANVFPLPTLHTPQITQPTWPKLPGVGAKNTLDLSDTYVIVGYGELGPYGTSNTRFAVEVSDQLSDVAVFELAWMTGLIRWENSGAYRGWIDTTADEPIAETNIADRFRDEVLQRSGIRPLESAFIDSENGEKEVLQPIYLEHPLQFDVATQELAHAFVAKAPNHSKAFATPDGWRVEFNAGATIRVPRNTTLSRRFAGQLPSGFDFERWGIPADMAARTDRLALMNLIATVEAFLSAGISPEELLARIHPVRIANTQGAGMGGMESLKRMYHDHLLGEERQNDILQESLINVVASYVVQSYVGSYGAMTHPVAACATAAVSIEEAWDKLRLGKADFVVAGAFDDIGAEGMIGFGDMSATAETHDIERSGLSAREASRPNDKRRRGFVESQGGGTLLLTRANIALELGLPVHGILGWAGSFGDGIQRSVPAPGQGLIAAISKAMDHNLEDALRRFGLRADDIGLIYKHDTSTPANDPNENRLHQEIQRHLGRTPGNPLPIVSQKWLTGHPKGGAAAWQSIGLMQCFKHGVIPGNRNLENVDPAMRDFEHLLFTDTNLRVPPHRLRAGLVTSLGFGHVNALLLLIHPHAFEAQLSEDQWQTWQRNVARRVRDARETRTAILRGETPAVAIRTERRFDAPDGSPCQQREEIDALLDESSRLDANGRFRRQFAAE